ncbi:MAG: class I SAM-dependent methyltransferase [Gammaproteobacteria bacterium]
MKKLISALVTLSFIATGGCAVSESLMGGAKRDAQIAAVVGDDTRLEPHRARDESRQPAAILQLAKVAPGDRVADVAAVGGYYTALLSRAVGADGKVYAVDPARIFEFFPQGREGFPKYIAEDPRDNVEYSVQNLDALRVGEQLDAIFMILYYHDTLWTGENRAAMNRAMLGALKPGGRLVIVDHSAIEGASEEVGKSLHRVDEDLVERELKEVGFRLSKRSDVLRNAEDPKDVSVFDEGWRGKTDRFVYVFERP